MEGTLRGSITRESSGDLVFRLVDAAGGEVRGRIGKEGGLAAGSVAAGSRVRITGVVGQRASRRGALDGYRVWLREAADLVVTAPPASSSPAATATPGPGGAPNASAGQPRVISIAAALRAGTGSASIEGTVTVKATLLDATGRRTIVQDASAAIEVRLPSAGPTPGVGARIRVTGELGRAYGAPRLAATAMVVLDGGSSPTPVTLRAAPGEAQEGILVRVEGRITDLRRLGDRWRAEMTTGAGTVVIAGLAGAAIPASALPEGTAVRVVGVVRRPHPSATDRRWAIVPRDPSDVVVLAAAKAPPNAASAKPGGSATANAASSGGARGGEPGPGSGPVGVDLDGLSAHPGERVQVGGLVSTVETAAFSLDDGTALGRVEVAGDALELLPLLAPGDAVGVTGRVRLSDGGPVVLLDDATDLVRLGDLGEPLPLAPAADPDAADPEPDDDGQAALAGDDAQGSRARSGATSGGVLEATPVAAGGAGLGAMLLAGGTAVALRRRRAHRIQAARIAARLAALETGGGAGSQPGTASLRAAFEPASATAPPAGPAIEPEPAPGAQLAIGPVTQPTIEPGNGAPSEPERGHA